MIHKGQGFFLFRLSEKLCVKQDSAGWSFSFIITQHESDYFTSPPCCQLRETFC